MSNSLVSRVSFRLLFPILAMSLILGLSLPALAQTKPQVDLTKKNVLVLHAFESNVPIFELTDRGIRAALDAGGVGIRNQFFEYLDLARNPGPEHRKMMAEVMRLRYSHRKIDVIVTMYAEALRFVLNEGSTIFPNAPVIALWMPADYELPRTDRPVIQHAAVPDMVGTLEIALKLLPNAKRLYVVCGVHENDRAWEARTRRQFEKWQDRLEICYLSSMPLEEILTTVSTAAPNTLVLILSFTTDVTGRIYTVKEVSQRVSRTSAVPVFGLYEVQFGQGIVGGSILGFEFTGTRAGEYLLEILRDTRTVENVPTALDVPPVPMFDGRQLRRWKLSEAALPKGSIVINRETTLWDFKYHIIVGIAIFLAQTLLVIGLLIQRRRKIVAEVLLRQKTEELNQFFNVSMDLLCIANTDGYFLRLNPVWKKTLGYTREELTAKRFLDFVHPDDLDRTQEAISTLASQQQVTFFENRYRCKDGTYRWLEWSSSPAGKLIYAAARDITERKQMQDKLRSAAEEWQTTFDSVRDLVMILDPEFKLVRVNAATLSFLDLPLERVLGQHCYDLMHGTNEPVGTCPLAKMLKTKRHEEAELYDEKTNAWLHVSVDPIFGGRGEIIRIIHTVKDISDRKRTEAEASRARKELLRMDRLSRMGELTASLAHELNQPLAAILSNSQAGLRFIQSEKPDLNELREILQDITSDNKRAGGVIRSLRAMMKQEEREREPLLINEMVKEVVTLFRSEAILRNVIIETDFAESLPPLLADKIQLQQVVLNLMMNAVDAMDHEGPERRKILLKTQRADHGVIQVTIRDYGSGIEKENLGRIFQSFFTTKGAGLGMGLSISRSIIEAHGGRLWVENNPDKGAIFFFELPVTSDQ